MSNDQIKVPVWFWVLSVVLLLWNAMGVVAFIQQMTMSVEAVQALPVDEQALYSKYPLWTKIAFAFAVFGGLLGCVGLLLRKSWAKPVFWLSLIGVVVQMTHSLFIAKAMDIYGPGAIVMPIFVLLVAGFLVWFSGYCITKKWIN